MQDVDGGGNGEAAGRQSHAAQNVEADPEAPGMLVAEVCGGAQPLRESHPGGVGPGRQNGNGDHPPEDRAEQLHRRPPWPEEPRSARATSALRLVSHHSPASVKLPAQTKGGIFDSAWKVSAGRGSPGKLSGSPSWEKGTEESTRTEVPPASCSP